jgi:gliding motility-associated-like protein
MSKVRFLSLLFLFLSPLCSIAQKVDPQAYYIDEEGNDMESRNVDKVDAPLDVTFRSNPSEMDDYSPSYEWHFYKMDSENGSELTPLFVRYEEDTQYTFTEAGTFHVVQKTYLGQDDQLLDSTLIVVVIPSSKLEFPNAFSPNGDGHNETYHAKEGYKGIVSFHATIINRWGQKLYEWNDPAGGWDGTFHGKPVRDGVYFVIVNAKGSDGVKYNIRKDVNLLRGLRDSGGGTGETDTPTE